jgi:shikimate kinase
VFRNLVLVGFMGSGKSSVGRLLAARTGFALVDTDNLVVQDAGMPIPDIFRLHGEEHFRRLETAALQRLVGRIGLIVATGGGVIVSPENRAILPRIGPVVWLDATTDHLHQRVRHSKRPLLQTENPRRTLQELYDSREPLYRSVATVRIDSTSLTHRQTAQAIIDALTAQPAGEVSD